MATRKRNTTPTTKIQTRPVKRRRKPISTRKKTGTGNIFNVLVPLTFIFGLLVGIGFLAFKGYQTVTASTFFEVKKIDIRGNSRVSKDEIEKIIRQETEKKGVWNAELEQIKAGVEKLSFVKTAVVTRILPDGIRVQVEERVPRAVVRLNGRDFWADDEAVDLGSVAKNENRPPFVLRGWDESKTEKSQKDNQERIKLYLKMQEEWQNLGLAKRIISINLSDLQDAQVAIEDSGETVSVFLGKEEYGKRLQRALPYLEGKGREIEYLKSYGGTVAVGSRNNS
jgi:cell division septal protein FtsQ